MRVDPELRVQEEYSVSGLGGSFGVTLAWRPDGNSRKRWELTLWEEVVRTHLWGLVKQFERKPLMQVLNLRRLCVGREHYRAWCRAAERMAADPWEVLSPSEPTALVSSFGTVKPLDGEAPVFRFRKHTYQLGADGKPRRLDAPAGGAQYD